MSLCAKILAALYWHKVIEMVRKYESTEVRQRQIVDAARKVIIKYGSEHVTVKRIAREVGSI